MAILFNSVETELPEHVNEPTEIDVYCQFTESVQNVHACMQGWEIGFKGNLARSYNLAHVKILRVEPNGGDGRNFKARVAYYLKDDTDPGDDIYHGHIIVLFIGEKVGN